MSIEKSIAELTQAVNMLTKSVDLNTATLAETNTSLIERLQASLSSVGHVEPLAPGEPLVGGSVEQAEAEPETLTDDEVKNSDIYKGTIRRMNELKAALEAAGSTSEEAQKDVLKLLKQYADDGKVLSFVRAAAETGESEAITEFHSLLEDKAKQAAEELQKAEERAANEAVAGDPDGKELTADDVKDALRKYASVEGRPAAVAMLRKLTDGKTEVKDVDPSKYADVIKGLQVTGDF